MSGERPLSICFVAYRGNMHCGGQGIYLWFLARELARLGHGVDVIVGPPWPDPMPFAGAVERVSFAWTSTLGPTAAPVALS